MIRDVFVDLGVPQAAIHFKKTACSPHDTIHSLFSGNAGKKLVRFELRTVKRHLGRMKSIKSLLKKLLMK